MSSNKRKFILHILFGFLVFFTFALLFYNAGETNLISIKIGLLVAGLALMVLMVLFVSCLLELIRNVIHRKILNSVGWLCLGIALLLIGKMGLWITMIYAGLGTYTDG